MDYKQRLIEAMYGVSLNNLPLNHYLAPKYSTNHNTPSYLVKYLFQSILPNSIRRGGDKSDWECSILFENKKWIIADRKMFEWNIYGEDDQSEIANKLRKKIVWACKILNEKLIKEAKDAIQEDRFTLGNVSNKAKSLFLKFQEMTEVEIISLKELNQKFKILGHIKEPDKITQRMNSYTRIKQNIEDYCFTSIVYFFSYTESLFDSCFSLLDRKDLSYYDFSNKSWSEKFKLFYKPWSPEIEKVFIELKKLRDDYRNPIVHSEPNRYFKLKGIGLVPVDMNDIFKPIEQSFGSIDETTAQDVFNLFNQFFKLSENHEQCRFALYYLDSGLPIYIDNDLLIELKESMENLDLFREKIEELLELEMAHINMDI